MTIETDSTIGAFVVSLNSKELTTSKIKTRIKCSLTNCLNDIFTNTKVTFVFPNSQIGYLYSRITRFCPESILIVEVYFWFREEAHLQFFLVRSIQLKFVASKSHNAHNIL